jgi:hypothetical protein
MTSQIDISKIDTTFPIPGRDNDSQGFRTNFSSIKQGLSQASSEISLLQAQKADLVEQSFFSNATQATSTTTGALTVAGGVGVGQDLYVGGALYTSGKIVSSGATAITTATPAPTTTALMDVVWTGTYGQPKLSLSNALYGNRSFRGTLAVGVANPHIAPNDPDGISLVYVGTTVTNQTNLYARNTYNDGTGLVIHTNNELASDGSYSFLELRTSPDGLSTSTISAITLSASTGTLDISGNWNFLGNVNVSGNINIGGALVNSVDGKGGVVQLSTLTSFTRSLTTSGYQKLPGGLIIQWGQTASWTAVTFPTTFTTIFTAVATRISGNGAVGEFGITFNKDGITPGTNGNTGPYSWMAFGV